MACAGVIAAVPATHDLTSVKQATVAAQVTPVHPGAAIGQAKTGYVSAGSTAGASSTASAVSTVSADSAGSQAGTYTVRSGDTLSSISKRHYNNAADWPWLWHENSSTVQNANVIYTGQHLKVPADPPANASSMSWYQPKHAAPASTSPPQSSGSTRGSSGGSTATETSAKGSASGLSGTLGCSGLEQLWDAAGGNPADAVLAASVAMAESSGMQFATGSAGEEGYWQINPVNGSLATYDPLGNARAAVSLSDNGTSWSAWTTFTTGAYKGKC